MVRCFTAILHTKGEIEKIVYLKDWEYDDNLIIVVNTDGTETPLPEYMKNVAKHKFYKDEFLLITRIFDNRIKAFINNILMANESVEHYSYRIEFQVRGLPHLHGVFWLNEEAVKNYKDENGDFTENVTELIDKWVSCSLQTGNPHLDAVVQEVNVHNHTKSCQKGGLGCRFDFPRLPSEETLIANPIADDELETEESKKKLESSKLILKEVKGQID